MGIPLTGTVSKKLEDLNKCYLFKIDNNSIKHMDIFTLICKDKSKNYINNWHNFRNIEFKF